MTELLLLDLLLVEATPFPDAHDVLSIKGMSRHLDGGMDSTMGQEESDVLFSDPELTVHFTLIPALPANFDRDILAAPPQDGGYGAKICGCGRSERRVLFDCNVVWGCRSRGEHFEGILLKIEVGQRRMEQWKYLSPRLFTLLALLHSLVFTAHN